MVKETPVEDQRTMGLPATSNSGVPTMTIPNMNLKMDIRKWSWPGYLTFGRTTAGKDAQTATTTSEEILEPESTPRAQEETGESKVNVSVEVDTRSLEEAMTSDTVVGSSEAGSSFPSSGPLESLLLDVKEGIELVQETLEVEQDVDSSQLGETSSLLSPSLHSDAGLSSPSPPRPEFPEQLAIPRHVLSRTYVHLADGEAPWLTTKRRMFHLTAGPDRPEV
jgi:hypothetical protein